MMGKHSLRKHRLLVLLVIVVLALGGRYGWQVWEQHRKAAAWEELLDGPDCTACAARKAGIAEKQKKRRRAMEQATETETSPVSITD